MIGQGWYETSIIMCFCMTVLLHGKEVFFFTTLPIFVYNAVFNLFCAEQSLSTAIRPNFWKRFSSHTTPP